ncbi:NAD-dependent epimerase/dehydratase family protein, partial [candidate division KSB1 bacterium]|nr:NAD-dependent epimerase/dehydratase family protein [candidate division KSB1 bacterium]NIR72187.1 NAD-dependent epimerase/dehydratase family protein [candidate division KSB1 bacterium]NIS26652.1 NAD-dependent epimerase/dehydratase family protein [candidate division KSB1 bacterium]NIT73420.1 NAD-dependent epimerase/dehydratase family protein [candidate division KSB1 bacterium]NIU27268.1 NAD-dependent epimerase/dehydratase family protein [candidate division KSB1 bacterium]
MEVKRKIKKTVFVTGGSGFVGKTLIERLLHDGFKIVALARRSNVPSHLKDPAIELVIGDVRNETCVTEAMSGADYVVHAAATLRGSWDDFSSINVEGTRRMLEAAVKNKVERFVYISSAGVYAHANLRNDAIYTEDMPYEEDAHASFYTKSKIEAEKLVYQYFEEHSLPIVIFRPGAIYGPGGYVFPATIGLGIGNNRIIAIGDRTTQLPLSYVENVVDAIVRSFRNEKAVGQCFNLTENETLSRGEYLKRLKSEANPNLKVLHFPLWFMKALRMTLKAGFGLIGRTAPLSSLNLNMYCTSITYSNRKYREDFGAESYVGFEQSIRRTVAWHRTKLTPSRSHALDGTKVVVPSDKKLRIGIIGCGYIGNVHLTFLKKFANAGDIVISDPQESALETFKRKYQPAGSYLDYKEMLAKERLDVVHILAPPQFHAEIAIAAAKKGVHIIMEKPIALDSEQTRSIVSAAKRHNIKLCVVHNHLYDKVMIQAREILAQEILGRITYIESWYGTQFKSSAPPFDPETYWGYSLPGSLYQDYLPHALYVFLDIMNRGNIRDVLANYAGGIPAVDTDELKILFENEKNLGLVSVSFSVSPRYQFMNVYGTKASMKIDFLNKVVLLDKEIGGVPKTINRALSAFKHSRTLGMAAIRNSLKMYKVNENLFEGTDRIIRLFYRSILLDEPVPVPAEEALQVMELMD